MSRVKYYGLDNKRLGQFQATVPRGYTVDGIRSTGSGSQSETTLSASEILRTKLNLGWMVMIEGRLPAWAGMIDTPWRARAPVGITIYPLTYLLSIRTPEIVEVLVGTVCQIVAQMIERINAQEELYLRAGDFDGDDIVRTETLDQRSFWEQLNSLVARAGKELYLRPAEQDGTLIIYVDVKDCIGVDTGWLLHDGKSANIEVYDPVVDGKIINQLIGIGSQSAPGSRMTTAPQINQASKDAFRLRSGVTQFQNVVDDTTLQSNTQNELGVSSWPTLRIPIRILDVGDTFAQLGAGNGYMLHVSKNFYLPGGVKRSFRGYARLLALAYDEGNGAVGGLMEAAYVPAE